MSLNHNIFSRIPLAFAYGFGYIDPFYKSLAMASSSLFHIAPLAALAALMFTAGTSAIWAVGIVRWTRQRIHGPTHMPRVSVIVAARDEEALIGGCVSSLLAQDYPVERFEIIVVDDHSTDATAEVAQAAGADQAVRMQVLRAPDSPAGTGPKKNALSFGIENSLGEVLLFTDADCRVPRGWIHALLAHYDSGTGAVTGAVFPAEQSGIRWTLAWLERFLVHYAAAGAMGYESPASAAGANLSYRRAAFDQLGGIAHSDVGSGDDDLMVQAIARAGWRVRFASGEDSIVREERVSDASRRLNAMTRHQSTVQYYPWRWRMAFALTILGCGLGLMTVLAAAAGLVSWWFVVVIWGLRLLIEAPAAALFARRLGVSLSPAVFLGGEILLPFYLLLRTIAAILPRYSWHGRLHRLLATDSVSDSA
jgi:cellulose synthase/poly-beta-1,6-N-acetylglucosamine synthase-like glycosyltransferase